MFGKNTITGQKFFKGAEGLMVTSRFMTLQGEGPYRGEPAFFIRLTKCQLACSFCDTWFNSGEFYSFDELEAQIDSTLADYFPEALPQYIVDGYFGLVLTGGEPMLQSNIGQFIEQVSNRFQWVQIESNGLILQDIPWDTTLVVSPKCLEKDNKPVKYLQPNPQVLKRADCLKFVMSSDRDSPYSEVPDWAFEYAKTGGQVFISPMNIYNYEPQKAKAKSHCNNTSAIAERSDVDETISFWQKGLLNQEENQKNHEYAARYCVDNGFVFNLQQHLYAGLP